MTQEQKEKIVTSVLTAREENARRAISAQQVTVQEISSTKAFSTLPLVSVEVVTYRHEKVLRQCVESVLAQQVDFPYEILIGVDASPDKTLEVAKCLQEEYPERIRLIVATENVGLNQNSRNVRLAMRGRFAALLEGDDWWLPGKLQKQIDYMRANLSCALCFSPEVFYYEQEHRAEVQVIQKVPRRKDWPMCMIGHAALPETSSVVCRVSDLKAIYEETPQRLSSEWMCQDVQLFASLAEKGDVYCFPEAMAVRRFSASSITGARTVEKQLIFLDNVFGFVKLMETACRISWWERNANFMRHLGQMINILLATGCSKGMAQAILHVLYPKNQIRLWWWFHVGLFLQSLNVKQKVLRYLFWCFVVPVVTHRKMFAMRPLKNGELMM